MTPVAEDNGMVNYVPENINRPLISVIMPAYNAEKFIERSINSVLAQTYTNWELIIVNDGSTDVTKEIIAPFCEKDRKIIYTYQENGKQGKARNTGIALAKGDLVAFLDADDVWFPFMLEMQYNLLIDSGADLVFSSVYYVDPLLNILPNKHITGVTELEGRSGAVLLLKGDNPMPISTILSRKPSLAKAGLFKTSDRIQFGEEYDLWIRMLLTGAKFVCNERPVAMYVRHQWQSSKLAESKYLQILEIITSLSADKDLEKVKKEATCIWIRRCLRFSVNPDREMVRKLIQFIPSFFARKISTMLSFFLPLGLLKKTIYKISYHI